MSGGSLDYGSHKIDDIASMIASRATTTLHRAFIGHLRKVSEAVHALEWMFSCDTGPGDEVAAIEACLPKDACLRQAVDDAMAAREALDLAILMSGIPPKRTP